MFRYYAANGIKRITALFIYRALFLCIFIPVLAQGTTVKWVVLQTTYSISGKGADFSAEFDGTSPYHCAFCGNIFKNPHQDAVGNRACHHCVTTMKTFIKQYGIKETDVNQDASGEYYRLLFQEFPTAKLQTEKLIKSVQALGKELEYNKEEYVFYRDARQERELKNALGYKAEAPRTIAFCEDCENNTEIDLNALLTHALEHRVICPDCGFTPEPASLTERQQRLQEHEVSCTRPCDHCQTELPVKSLPLHESGCLKRTITCSGCDETFPIGTHFQHVVQYITITPGKHDVITCPSCERQVQGLRYKTHHDALHAFDAENQLACPFCQQAFPCGSELFIHATHDHPAEAMTLIQESAQGPVVIVDQSAPSEDTGTEATLTGQDRQRLVHIFNIFMAVVPSSVHQGNSNEVALLASELEQIRLDNTAVKAKKLNQHPIASNTEIAAIRQQIDTITEKNTQLEQQLQTLKQQKESVSHTSSRAYQGRSSAGSDTEQTSLQKQVASLTVHVSELELQFQAGLASTYDGSFLWRIPDIGQHKRKAIDERVTSIYSPTFYTSHTGYKMCVRAYLNGDGMGYKTHLSLFFVLMRGEHDPLLKWPFEYKVSMILVDQTHRKHIVQTFKPTPESNSFQRPQSDMNVASGCPQFAKLTVFDDDNYVKGDVIYIKCIIDTTKIFHP